MSPPPKLLEAGPEVDAPRWRAVRRDPAAGMGTTVVLTLPGEGRVMESFEDGHRPGLVHCVAVQAVQEMDRDPLTVVIAVMASERVRRTNPKCGFKTDVVDDGSEPTMRVELGGDHEGKKILFEAGLLSSHDILEQFNRIVLPLVKDETETATQSKGEKMRKAGNTGKKGR